MNVWDILILLAVALLLLRAVRRIRKGKTCNCGCEGCTRRDCCNNNDKPAPP